eukprot:scaffold18373_cov154-Amphora_coffeaeformis.AAC.10
MDQRNCRADILLSHLIDATSTVCIRNVFRDDISLLTYQRVKLVGSPPLFIYDCSNANGNRQRNVAEGNTTTSKRIKAPDRFVWQTSRRGEF